MGLGPNDVDNLSLSQFFLVVEGHNLAHNPEGKSASYDDLQAIAAGLDDKPLTIRKK